jgi:uncharacterized membrane protein
MTRSAAFTLRAGAMSMLALLLLELAWHAFIAPSSRAALALSTLPLLPGLSIAPRDLRRGVLVGGIASLFYFGHGVADLMVDRGATRLLAGFEAVLAFAIIVTPWLGARGRRAQAGEGHPHRGND